MNRKIIIHRFDIAMCIYIIFFIAIMYSGSTFISNYIMQLICLVDLLLFAMAKIKGFRKNAFLNKNEKYIFLHFIILIIFFIFQLSFSFNKSVTLVFVERFIAYLFLLIFIPQVNTCFITIKSMRLYSFIVAGSILIVTIATGTKSGGLVGDFQFSGMMMSISFGIILIDYFFEQNYWNIIGLALTFLALLSSGKRTFSLIAVIAFILISFIIKKRRKFIYIFISMILLVSVAYITVPAVRLVFERFTEYFNDNTFNGRKYYWIAAFEIFKSNKLLGIGMGTFSKYFDTFYHRFGNLEAYDAHNTYIQILAETGIVGTVLLLLFFFIILIKTIKLFKNKEIKENQKCLYILCYSLFIQVWFLVYGFTGNPLYGAGQFFFYISGVAMMISLKSYIKNKMLYQ